MSPRRVDPRARPALIDVAAQQLAEDGPQALSARRIAAKLGTSTMAVYTHFGSMSGLVREMVHEGFARLQQHLTRVSVTADPVADMALIGRAYRYNALTNRHLYSVMFGGATPARFELAERDRQHGRYTLVNVVQCAQRCVEAGRFRGDPALIAHQMWTATHGLVTLELGDYLVPPWNADLVFHHQLTSLMVGAGDEPAAAENSVIRSAERFPLEVARPANTAHPKKERTQP